MRRVSFLVATAVALGCAPDPEPAPAPAHVVVVVIDTTRADRCSVNGYERETTPGLTALAAESVVFENCWAPAPWTGPSHASLFTGLRPENHGFLRSLNDHLPDAAVTLAEQLTDAGYDTRCISTNPNVGPSRNLVQGFETYEPAYRFVEETVAEEHGRGVLRAIEYMPVQQACASALEHVKSADADGRRAFTFVNLLDPHLNYDPPADAAQLFLREVPPAVEQWARRLQFPESAEPAIGAGEFGLEQWAALSDLYDAEIYTADRAVAELVEGLRASGLLDDTLLIVTSDHGESLGERGLADHQFDLHAQLLRVPLIVRWPGARDAGTRHAELVRLEDVHPTVLEAAGLAPAGAIDGIALSDDLDGRVSWAATDPPTESLDILRGIYPGSSLARAERAFRSVASGRWHLIEDDLDGVWLYDTVTDPGETHDLARSRPETLRSMRELLRRAHSGW